MAKVELNVTKLSLNYVQFGVKNLPQNSQKNVAVPAESIREGASST
jgi:hypothetical protein